MARKIPCHQQSLAKLTTTKKATNRQRERSSKTSILFRERINPPLLYLKSLSKLRKHRLMLSIKLLQMLNLLRTSNLVSHCPSQIIIQYCKLGKTCLLSSLQASFKGPSLKSFVTLLGDKKNLVLLQSNLFRL